MLIAPAFHLFKDTLAQDSPGFAQRFFHAPSPCWGHTCLSCILSPPAFRVFLHWMRLQKNGAHTRALAVASGAWSQLGLLLGLLFRRGRLLLQLPSPGIRRCLLRQRDHLLNGNRLAI